MVTEAGNRVLIPRPQRQPDRFAERLRREGFEPCVLPVIEIIPDTDPALARRLSSAVHAADDLIFVSGNAVDSCLALLEACNAKLPVHRQYFAVGRSTAEALQQRGMAVNFPARQADSEGVLALPALRQPGGRQILICRGRGGREKLARELRQLRGGRSAAPRWTLSSSTTGSPRPPTRRRSTA